YQPHSRSNGSKEVSIEGLWSLLEGSHIENLELLDLECVSNENLTCLVERVKNFTSISTDQQQYHHPLTHQMMAESRKGSKHSNKKFVPGESIRHLTITKFTSVPLTLPAFGSILKLFPKLESFTLKTNFF